MPQTHIHIDLTICCVRSTTTGQLTLRCYPVQGNINMKQHITSDNEVDPRTLNVPPGKSDCLILRVQLYLLSWLLTAKHIEKIAEIKWTLLERRTEQQNR